MDWGDNVAMERGVFLDLNGTLVEPLKPESLDDVTVIPGAVDAVARLSAAGFVCPVVTVQSRIAKGLFSAAEFDAWFARLAVGFGRRGAMIVGPYVCPHRFAEPCLCKKPNTFLYDQAATEHNIALSSSFVVGDSPDDVRAARGLGAKGCLVRTGWAADLRVVEEAARYATVIVLTLDEAVSWILNTPMTTMTLR
jgi:D-glycero-D-manno-heptose 1,7-bisphosphate phosphatase